MVTRKNKLVRFFLTFNVLVFEVPQKSEGPSQNCLFLTCAFLKHCKILTLKYCPSLPKGYF